MSQGRVSPFPLPAIVPSTMPLFQHIIRYKPDYDKITKSSIVTFLVGVDAFPMTIHANAIESLSIQLNTMVNDSYVNGSIGGVITLPDMSVEAFQAFTEFAYTGDYSHVAPHSTPEIKRKADEANISEEDTPSKKQEATLGSQSDIASIKLVETTAQSDLATPTIPNPEARSSTNPNESTVLYRDFIKLTKSLRTRFKSLNYGHRTVKDTPRLYILVDLYVFATKYSIEALRQKTLSSLHWRLCSYSHQAPPEDVVPAIEVMYSKVSEDESGQLRELCMRYAACQAALLHRSVEFEALLRSNPDFAIDFVRALAE